MKKIIMLTLCVFFSHAYAGSSDDPDFFKNRYQTGNWTHNKVTPYNTAGSTQPDYYNSSKYNVNSSRDVTSNGSKYKQTVNVAVEASKAEKAATLANRAKNFAKYAKNLGKASLPAFLGSAALTALLDGVGWVMDEGGKVTRLPTDEDGFLCSSAQRCTGMYIYKTNISDNYTVSSTSLSVIKNLYIDSLGSDYSDVNVVITNTITSETFVKYEHTTTAKYRGSDWRVSGTLQYTRFSNPNYDPNVQDENIEVSPDEIADAIKKALEANNAAQAEAIAQAIKDAFSDSQLDTDPETGTKNNPISEKTKTALDEKGAAELKEDADPTVCVPREGDLNGQCHSMPKSEADAQPALKCEKQGWQIDTDDSCVYVVDPDAPTKPGTVDKPKVDPESGELPDACTWFDVHCKWLEWTKEDDLDDDTELDLDAENEPDANTDIEYSGSCPADKKIPLPYPFNFDYLISYEPICTIAEDIKPAVIASGLWISVLILGGIRGSD